ncbi:MAG TPA: hypothetical protein VIT23_08760 [Terrimicrobiaceae bacterium]
MHQLKKITVAVMTLACISWLSAEAQDLANSQQQAGVSQFKETSGLKFIKLFDLESGWRHIAMNYNLLYTFKEGLLYEWGNYSGQWQKTQINLENVRKVTGFSSSGGKFFVSADRPILDQVLIIGYKEGKQEVKSFSNYYAWKPQALAKSDDYIFMADTGGRILRKAKSSSNDKYDTPEVPVVVGIDALAGVCASSDGKTIYWVDRATHCVGRAKETSEGVYFPSYDVKNDFITRLSNPNNVAIDGNGNIYVSDLGDLDGKGKGTARIKKYTAEGEFCNNIDVEAWDLCIENKTLVVLLEDGVWKTQL